MRLLETNWTDARIQLLFSVKPTVSPVIFTARAKGRLQHALRAENESIRFSRKIGFRTIGENNREQVELYVRNQVAKERFVDGNFGRLLAEFTSDSAHANLSLPSETNSGRYWYDLHLVLVTHLRGKISDSSLLSKLDDCISRVALKKGHEISVRSLMPDHLHLALRGNIDSSPEDIALSYMNNTSFCLNFPIWQSGYYVGTFGEYDIGAIRSALR